MQNLNQANIQSRFNAYQAQVKAFVESTKANATVGDVLGTQTIVAKDLPFLPASMPYPIKALAARYSELPDSLRHHFRYQLYLANAPYSDPLMDWNVPTVTIAGKKITMAWVAATQADADAIASYLPKAHADGSPIQPSELPTGLPASIHVKMELRVEGTKVADGGSYSIGTELQGAGAFTSYADLFQYDESQDSLIAGQQSALGVSIQGISQRQLNHLQARLTATKTQVTTNNFGALTGEQITGDMLTSNIWEYLGSLQMFGSLAQRQNAMVDRPALSYGLFHAVAQPNQLYGVVTTSVSFKGVNMDVGHLRHIRWVQDDSNYPDAKNRWTAYNQMRGQQASALENEIPEGMFVDRSQCMYADTESGIVTNPSLPACEEGISAVKALVIASQQGQKIFTISSANANIAIAQLQQSSSVVEEVKNAIATGKTVIIHQSPINAFGWSGAGYVEVDLATGASAALIEGKGSGGWWSGLFGGVSVGAILAFMGLAVAAASSWLAVAAALIAGLFFLIIVGITLALIQVAYYSDEESAACFVGGFGTGMIPISLVPGAAWIASLIGAIIGLDIALHIPNNTYDQCRA